MSAFDRIGDYLEGRLSDNQQVAFEAEMARNPKLAEEVQLEQETRQLLQLHKQAAYKEELQELDARMQRAAHLKQFRRRWWGFGVVAASILLALGIWGLWSTYDPYEEAFAPYPDRLTTRSQQGSYPLNRAMEAYNTGDYRQAIEQFVAVNATADPETSLYLGISHLADQNYAEALSALQTLSDTSLYYQPAQWYMALTYGQMGKAAQARLILQAIRQQADHAYQQQAADLLAKIE